MLLSNAFFFGRDPVGNRRSVTALRHTIGLTVWLVSLTAPPLLAADANHSLPTPLEASQKELVKISESGFSPSKIILNKLDASLFFVNVTKRSLLSLRIVFNNRELHCASGNVTVDTNGDLITSKPIPPKDFILVCFPQAGDYKVIVQGVGQKARPIETTVTVTAG